MANKFVFHNYAETTITDTPLLIGATTMNVNSNLGMTTPASGYKLRGTLVNPADYSDWEIVEITAISGTAFTVTREAEDAADHPAQEWPSGTLLRMQITAEMLDGMLAPDFSLDVTNNALGSNAIDIQTSRSAASQAATGASAIAVGTDCTASAADAVAIGSATASGTDAVAIGNTATATDNDAIAIGPTADATAGYGIAIGQGSQADGDSSIVLGRTASSTSVAFNSIAIGMNASTADSYHIAIGSGATSTGFTSMAVGRNATAGSFGSALGHFSVTNVRYAAALGYKSLANREAQVGFPRGKYTESNRGFLVAHVQTVDGTATTFLDEDQTNFPFDIPADHTLAFTGVVVAQKTDQTENAAWKIEGIIKNDSGTTTLIASSVTEIGSDNSSAWTLALAADDTNDCLQMQLTAEATVNATASLHFVEQASAAFTS